MEDSPLAAPRTNRRLAHGLALCALACGAAAVALIATSSATAQQGGGGTVTITPLNGGPKTVRLADHAGAEDLRDRGYTVRTGAGETAERVTGFSLRKLLELADVDTFGFGYAEITRPGGGAVLLSRHQVLDEGAFPEGPPPVYPSAGGLAFLRPVSGAGDVNADDSFVASDGQVAIALRDGKLLEVEASASPARTKPGKPVRFAATVARSGSGEQLTYSWFFSDGSSGKGATVTHKFKKPGSYNVVVGVTTPGDEVGASESVRVQVGKPRSGPDRTGGGADEASPLDSGPTHGGSGSGPATSQEAPATAGGRAEAVVPPLPAGEVVEGELLDADAERPLESDAPPSQSDERAGARTGDPGSGGSGVPDEALGLLVAMGMLGTGALMELRGLRSLRSW
jgi:hypothetical protein